MKQSAAQIEGQSAIDAADAALWPTGTVATHGGRLAYHRRQGPGLTLLLSHGLSDNGLCWQLFVRSLPIDWDIILLDARGHGRSARIVAGQSWDPGKDIADTLDWLGIATASLVGHSVGALACLACASAHPERISALVLEDPPLLPPVSDDEATHRAERFGRDIMAMQAMNDDDMVARGRALSPSWHSDHFPAWVQGKRQVDLAAIPPTRIDWQAMMAAIAIPTLLVLGDSDSGSLVSDADTTAVTNANARVRAVRIAGAGHNVRRERPDAFADAAMTFLIEAQDNRQRVGEWHGINRS